MEGGLGLETRYLCDKTPYARKTDSDHGNYYLSLASSKEPTEQSEMHSIVRCLTPEIVDETRTITKTGHCQAVDYCVESPEVLLVLEWSESDHTQGRRVT